jgi:hypothetical protein
MGSDPTSGRSVGCHAKKINRDETYLHPEVVDSQVEVAWESLWEYLPVIWKGPQPRFGATLVDELWKWFWMSQVSPSISRTTCAASSYMNYGISPPSQ